jgi:hypothetical protein
VTYHSRFRPELAEDIAEAFHYYEERCEGLGQLLLKEFHAAVAEVERTPEFHLKAFDDFRRVLLRRFPYALYFRLEEDSIVFVLLVSGMRNPKRLQARLRKRESTNLP